MTRWKFPEATAAAESFERAATVERIDAWWQAFASKIEDLDALFERRSQWDLPAWMHQHLHGIDTRLMWEFAPAQVTPGRRLVITPEVNRHLRPLVDEILRRAPKVDGWEFYAYRQPESADAAQVTIEARCGGSIDGWQVHAMSGDDNCIDLTYFVPGLRSKYVDAAMERAFVATESLLGEETLDKWIGGIDVAPIEAPRGLLGLRRGGTAVPPDAIPIERLGECIASEREQIRDALPSDPHDVWVEDSKWAVFELSPAKAPDCGEQDDLFVAKTPNLPLWKATRSAGFYDERFTRCGETFCYVKLDGSEGPDAEQFVDKPEIEDAIDSALAAEKLGCQIGGGTGRRYSYIELALTDLHRGAQAIRERLRSCNVPRRSWLLFHNADLRGEWIGMYEDSPAPTLST